MATRMPPVSRKPPQASSSSEPQVEEFADFLQMFRNDLETWRHSRRHPREGASYFIECLATFGRSTRKKLSASLASDFGVVLQDIEEITAEPSHGEIAPSEFKLQFSRPMFDGVGILCLDEALLNVLNARVAQVQAAPKDNLLGRLLSELFEFHWSVNGKYSWRDAAPSAVMKPPGLLVTYAVSDGRNNVGLLKMFFPSVELARIVGTFLGYATDKEVVETDDELRSSPYKRFRAPLRSFLDKYYETGSFVGDREPYDDLVDRKSAYGHIDEELTAGDKAQSPPIPARAPARWSKERLATETPIDFINRIYAPWIGNGLSRPDIRRLDKPLYLALAKHIERHGLPEGFELPSKPEINDRWVERVKSGQEPPPSDYKGLGRLMSAIQRRQK